MVRFSTDERSGKIRDFKVLWHSRQRRSQGLHRASHIKGASGGNLRGRAQ